MNKDSCVPQDYVIFLIKIEGQVRSVECLNDDSGAAQDHVIC